MIPTRLATRNRWWTLAWAAGICWTAVEVAGPREGATSDNAAAVAGSGGGNTSDPIAASFR